MTPVRLLITDLDNTLYDWVTYFATAFEAMTKALVPLLDVDEETLRDEFKTLHQRYGNSEQPFALFDLPSVGRRFGPLSMIDLRRKLRPAIDAFEEKRRLLLRLYDAVDTTLAELRRRSVVIVGHTEATAGNAFYRLRQLGIVEHFRRLYAVAGHADSHLSPEREAELAAPEGLLRLVPKSERKPNPRLLQDICEQEGFAPAKALYVGDSLTRDISMAKAAGVTSVWAEYGTRYESAAWRTLVRISHWTDDDVRREAELKQRSAGLEPDYTIDSFAELLDLKDIAWGDRAPGSGAPDRDAGEIAR